MYFNHKKKMLLNMHRIPNLTCLGVRKISTGFLTVPVWGIRKISTGFLTLPVWGYVK